MSEADNTPCQRLLLVTGPSGAGRSTALNVLEDLGFEVIDNLPLSLIPRLLTGEAGAAPLALGVDTRNRDFEADALADLTARLREDPAVDLELLYLDCSPEVLLRRFSETRRRHPLAPEGSPAQGVARDIDLLAPLRGLADTLIDTSEMSPHDLRAQLTGWFGQQGGARLAVSVLSFSYKRGTPREADLVFDCRFLRNPHWEAALRPKTGLAPEIAGYVAEDPLYRPFFDKVLDLITLLLPAYQEEGKAHLTIAFGCTGGKHRSVTLAEKLSDALAASGWRVSKRHRELERRLLAEGTNAMGTGA